MSGRRPTPEQAAAIGAAAPSVMVEAGAGTGKTGVMVDRYCRVVCDQGVSPDAVLAFTFTEKAAAELRERIRTAIEARAAGGSERARELLPSLGGAWVTTIHGFCNRLLAGHPVAAGIDPRFRVLDATETERTASEASDWSPPTTWPGCARSRSRSTPSCAAAARANRACPRNPSPTSPRPCAAPPPPRRRPWRS